MRYGVVKLIEKCLDGPDPNCIMYITRTLMYCLVLCIECLHHLLLYHIMSLRIAPFIVWQLPYVLYIILRIAPFTAISPIMYRMLCPYVLHHLLYIIIIIVRSLCNVMYIMYYRKAH